MEINLEWMMDDIKAQEKDLKKAREKKDRLEAVIKDYEAEVAALRRKYDFENVKLNRLHQDSLVTRMGNELEASKVAAALLAFMEVLGEDAYTGYYYNIGRLDTGILFDNPDSDAFDALFTDIKDCQGDIRSALLQLFRLYKEDGNLVLSYGLVARNSQPPMRIFFPEEALEDMDRLKGQLAAFKERLDAERKQKEEREAENLKNRRYQIYLELRKEFEGQ